jgi:hypothetical protein
MAQILFVAGFVLPDMTLPLRYAASVMDCTQKVKQNLKGTKYVNTKYLVNLVNYSSLVPKVEFISPLSK